MVTHGTFPYLMLPYVILALGGAVGPDALELVQDYNKK